ncbi:MAG TPA: hypothetical protein PLZ36_00750 [Armatimonadota bacterium]|nr:hypothetical protein [Armatimonadota bacterium]
MKTFVLFVILLLGGALFAQVAPNGGALMVNTPKGIFALRSGVLARIAPATLKVEKVMQIYGALPEPPAQGAAREAFQQYYAEVAKRNAPAILLVKDGDLLLVTGDIFARINQDTLKVEATANLKDPAETADPNQRGVRQEPAPGYLLVNTTLYLLRSKDILSVEITDGKLTRQPLPAQLQPVQPTFQGGGGRGPGGNAGGGGRN